MIDLTEVLQAMQVSQSGGPLDSCVQAVENLVRELGAWTDWDDYSDEFWARLLVEREVAAVVCMYNPLIFVVSDVEVRDLSPFTVIRVPGFDAECLSADQAVLIDKLGDRGRESEISAEMFSLSDLWAASV